MSRLPILDSDEGTWGSILNDYLSVSHQNDGQLKDDVITSGAISDASITTPKLATTSAPTSGQVLSYNGSELSWSTSSGSGLVPDADSITKGLIQLSGALSGTAASPTLTDGTVTSIKIAASTIVDANIAAGAAIAQSKISGLSVSLSGKEPVITAGTTAQYYRGDKTFQALDKTAVGLSNVDNTSDVTKNSATVTLTNKTISGASNIISAIAQSSVTSLTADLAAKAADSAVVHNTGTETIAGVKTFSSSPIVPTPTTGTQAATKAYVDTTVSAGAADATTTSKGLVQLAGDLSGTAASPTVPGLTAKAPLASPALTGTPTVPTAAVNTNTTQAASTAFVVAQAASTVPLVNGAATVGTSTRFARGDHVHPIDTSRLAVASNLSDLASVSTARTNLGLGNAAVATIGTTSGTVAAGNDSRITNAVQSTTITAIVKLTQAAYDAIGSPVSTTLYVVVG